MDAAPVLYRIARLAGTDEPGAALRSILAETANAFRASSGSIALLNPETGKLHIEVQIGLPEGAEGKALRIGQGVTGWVALHGRPLLIADVAGDPRYVPVRPGVRCEMATPMTGDHGQVMGVINLDADREGAFQAPDLETFVRITQEATWVMRRLWQIRQLQGKARQLETLLGLGQTFVTKTEEQELIDTVAGEAPRIIACRLCTLQLYDNDRKTLRMVGLSDPAFLPQSCERPAQDCLAGSVVQTKKPIELLDMQGPEAFDLVDLPRDPALRSVLASPMIYEDQVIGVLSVFTDRLHRFNNDEKRLLQALASFSAAALQNCRVYSRVFDSEDRLRKSERLTTLGLLAAEIAHEVRNPLTVIKLLFESLGLDFTEADPRRKDAAVIAEKLDQLDEIVGRVLAFAKAPAEIHARWALGELIHESLVMVRYKLQQSKIRTHIEPPAGPIFVEANKGQLQQVLLNLILNAAQAMPEGGDLVVRWRTAAREGAPVAEIEIEDSGGGIPVEVQERIFDPFLSGREGGVGLGLAIVRRILAAHRGDIRLVRTGPEGTLFRAVLPVAV